MHLLRGLQQAVLMGFSIFALLCGQALAQKTRAPLVVRPDTSAKIYRGSIGSNHIEMILKTEGNSVSGTYAYDRIGQDIKLNGHRNSEGQLELEEIDATGKRTGKFVCKREPEVPDTDSECQWSKPDGTGEKNVILNEQHWAFTNGLRIVPKVIANRKTGVAVSYPQITGGSGSMAAAIEKFNGRVSYLVNKAIKDFEPEATPDHAYFEANYNVLLGTNDLVSLEMYDDWYAGGAHPSSDYRALTYDLSANRELRLSDLFTPRAEYKSAIITRALADINKRAEKFEKENAEHDGRKAEPRDEPLFSSEELSEISAWAMTPKGLMIYFDFPHAIAALDKTFIPYSVVKAYLKPNAPAARFAAKGTGRH